MAALKYSRQRESIKEFLRSRTDHPTADTVYENLRQIYPNISLGTVYRNLSLLSDIGEIRKLTNFGSADRYDGRVAPHSHFMCTRCNRVIDMQSDSLNGILFSGIPCRFHRSLHLRQKPCHGQILRLPAPEFH